VATAAGKQLVSGPSDVRVGRTPREARRAHRSRSVEVRCANEMLRRGAAGVPGPPSVLLGCSAKERVRWAAVVRPREQRCEVVDRVRETLVVAGEETGSVGRLRIVDMLDVPKSEGRERLAAYGWSNRRTPRSRDEEAARSGRFPSPRPSPARSTTLHTLRRATLKREAMGASLLGSTHLEREVSA
jgi:hypothetical protein